MTCLSSLGIDGLVPDILLEYDGYLGEDGAQAISEVSANTMNAGLGSPQEYVESIRRYKEALGE
jgi:hypothetical protein